jgi:hypothetical protein
MRLTTLEAIGAISGIAGATLLATNDARMAPWGWVAFLASNVAWLAFATVGRHNWLALQTVGFTASTIYGIWNWIVKPLTGAA